MKKQSFLQATSEEIIWKLLNLQNEAFMLFLFTLAGKVPAACFYDC